MLGGVLVKAHARVRVADLIAFVNKVIRIREHVTWERMLYTWHLCLRLNFVSSSETTGLDIIGLCQATMSF